MLRVAIVGLGPKGLFALERLLDRANIVGDRARLDVDVFEADRVPGAGPVYDPGQPEYLRMNVPARGLDLWWPTNRTVPCEARGSFVVWSERRGERCDATAYPPRAQVGRYLSDGLAAMLRHGPPSVGVAVLRARADTIRPRDGRWDVVCADGARSYDEVLLAVGHERSVLGGLARDWPHAAALAPSVFPVLRSLSTHHVAPGGAVGVRGFALTFIDAALALTEGRGGSFETLEHPYRLRYASGDDDVRVILPFSRTGRAMLAKPGPTVTARTPALDEIAERGRSQILGLAQGADLPHDLRTILAANGAHALRAVGDARPHQRDDRRALTRWLAAAAAGAQTHPPCDPVDELERGLAVAAGVRPPDVPWALGHTWRTLYPAIVARLGGDALTARQWPEMRRLGAEMERIAFGPSPSNVAKLLALVEAGRVDLTHVRGGYLRDDRGRTLLCSAAGARPVDVVVDAVLPGPGASSVSSEPLGGLLAAGCVAVAPGRRGLAVDDDGGCRDVDGCAASGLSAIGRATEDVIIGNDTLNRCLHPVADRWARKVIRRSLEDAALTTSAARQADVA